MLYPPDFEQRTLDAARRWTDDIRDCDRSHMKIVWPGAAPVLRFVFDYQVTSSVTDGDQTVAVNGRPFLGVSLVAQSRSNPLAEGRPLQGEELRRHIRSSIETYLKADGIQMSVKAMQHAHV